MDQLFEAINPVTTGYLVSTEIEVLRQSFRIYKFLERGEMGYSGENKNFLNIDHVSDIFDEFPIVRVTESFEQNQDE